MLETSTNVSVLNAPPININGSQVTIDGLERDNSVFVPARGFFEKLGAQVINSGSSLVATRQGRELARTTIGSRTAMVNGSSHMLAVAPFQSQLVTMLPLRVISEAAGASVSVCDRPAWGRRHACGRGAGGYGRLALARHPAFAYAALATGASPCAEVHDKRFSRRR